MRDIYRVEAGLSGDVKEQEEIKIPKGQFDGQLIKIQEAMLLAQYRLDGHQPLPRTVHIPDTEAGAENVLQELGEELFDLLFCRKVYACFDKQLDDAQRSGSNLRIRLCIEAKELAHLPWETLYNTS